MNSIKNNFKLFERGCPKIFKMNNLDMLLKENFDTFLILVLIFFLIKEGVEDMETILLLVLLFFN